MLIEKKTLSWLVPLIAPIPLSGVMLGALPASAQTNEPIQPLPLEIKLDSKRVALGEKLFNDKRLSKDDTLACVSCHELGKGGVDRTRVSTGIGGAKGSINAPTVFNSGFNFRQLR